MTQTRRPAVALLLLAALLAAVASALPAVAHTVLRSSVPADGAVVPIPPQRVELRFDGSVVTLGTEVAVGGPAGPLGLEPVVVEGATVTQPLPQDLPAGTYTVAWRATSADGHPVSGELTFSADAPSASQPPTAQESAPAPPSTQPDPLPQPDPSPQPEPSSTDAVVGASPPGGGGLPTVAWVVLGGGAVAALGGATVALKGRRPPSHG